MDAASLLLPILLIAVFYFLLIRPQQKQRRQMAEMQQSISPGTRVMTGAGLLGTVVSIDDDKDEVVLEVAPGVTNTYVRRAIVNVVTPVADTSDPASDTPVEDRPDFGTSNSELTNKDKTDTPDKEDSTNGDDVR